MTQALLNFTDVPKDDQRRPSTWQGTRPHFRCFRVCRPARMKDTIARHSPRCIRRMREERRVSPTTMRTKSRLSTECWIFKPLYDINSQIEMLPACYIPKQSTRAINTAPSGWPLLGKDTNASRVIRKASGQLISRLYTTTKVFPVQCWMFDMAGQKSKA